MKHISVHPTRLRIEFDFPFSVGMKNRVKNLPDCRYDGNNRVWWMPATEFGAITAVRFGKEHGFFIDRSVLDLSRNSFNFKKLDSVRSKMYPFQVAGLDFAHGTGGRFILADEMGLGKTITALGFIEERGFSKVLIVSPASVTYKWQAEIKRWLDCDADVITKSSQPIATSRFTIMSYAIFNRKIESIRRSEFQVVVYDESHYLANKDSQRSRAARSLLTPYVICLSGTPFLNRPIELWTQLNILNPGKWSSYWKYAIRYCGAYRDRFGWDVSGATNLNELKQELKGYFLRRTKQEVMSELPAITRVYLPVDWDHALAHTYSETLKETRRQAVEGKLKGATRLQQIAELRQIIGMMKVSSAVEFAEDTLKSKSKVVLFAHHKSVVSELVYRLEAFKPVTVVGDDSQSDRMTSVDRFLHDPQCRVAVISIAGGEGIDLYSADTLIFVEREWNPGKESQIEGRLHRIGQQNPVQVYYLIARGTIDERIHNLIEHKREVFGKIISLDDIPVLDLLEV